MSLQQRHNVNSFGAGPQAIIFAHGFGCDQSMWRFVAPAFSDRFRVILFDHLGSGGSDWASYDPESHSSLHGYADDVVSLCRELEVRNGIFVGHSVSAMIGVLAVARAPELFEKLVLIGPSPGYINDGDYFGGFEEDQITELLEFADSNFMGWSSTMAPVIMANADRPELAIELADSFCRHDPEIAKRFARATFLSDNRSDLEQINVPSLILQCSEDVIAPAAVGDFVHQHLAGSRLISMKATGHCPNLSAPAETIAAMNTFL